MAGISNLKDDDSSSFFTTPGDDVFHFSNLSPSHMSILEESGPFVALVLSCWDNLLGPRLQHVWRGNGDTESQVKLDIDESMQLQIIVLAKSLSKRRKCLCVDPP